MATKRKDGRWMSRAMGPKGKPIFGYGATPEEAREDLARKLTPPPAWTPRPGVTLDEFARGFWLPSVQRLEESSIARYTSSYGKFIRDDLGHLPVDGIRFITVRAWANELETGGVSVPSIRYAKEVLSMILNLAIDCELATANPCGRVKLTKPKEKRVRVMSIEKAIEVLDAVKGSEMSAPVFLGCVLGLCRGEVSALKWSHLDRRKLELQIRVQRRASKGNGIQEKQLKTENRYRTLRLTRELVDEIDSRGNLDSEYICTHNGLPWVPDTMTEHWTAIKEKLGLPHWTFHDLRHGFAGLLRASGGDLLEAKTVLGHANPDMSAIYTDVDEQRMDVAMERMAKSLGLVDKQN